METKIWVTIYNAKRAITDGLFVNEIRLTKTFQAKTPNLSPPHALELLEGFSFSTRGTRVNRPWHKGSEIIRCCTTGFTERTNFISRY